MGKTQARSAAAVLLELLDKVPDASTLEVLLEAEHLIKLLRLHGWADDDVRRQLKGGVLPGELLLQLLAKEPDARKLLAELGNPAPSPPGRRQAPGNPVAARAGTARLSPIVSLIVGALLALPSGWYLFVRLDVLRVPGLIRYFPGAYALYFAVLLTGLFLLFKGATGLLRSR